MAASAMRRPRGVSSHESQPKAVAVQVAPGGPLGQAIVLEEAALDEMAAGRWASARSKVQRSLDELEHTRRWLDEQGGEATTCRSTLGDVVKAKHKAQGYLASPARRAQGRVLVQEALFKERSLEEQMRSGGCR